jgi:uncharacterized protein YbjT (DUF2867 family)
VLTGDPARLPRELQEHTEVFRGSADNAATLSQALDGVEALFWCAPSESLRETNVRNHYERFARAGFLAIRKARTPRVVTISAGGRGLARSAGPVSGLHAMEDILNQSGAAIRHLRCPWFMENFLGQVRSMCRRGLVSYPMRRHIPIPMAAATDIADVALRWLVQQNWKGIEGIPVHGPEDLSFAQAAAVMERMLERPVQYWEASPNHYARVLIRLGASAEYARSRIELFSELARGIARAEQRTAESTTPTTLSAWAGSELVPLAESFRPRSELQATFLQNQHHRTPQDRVHHSGERKYA